VSKAVLVYAFVWIDIILNAFVDSNPFPSAGIVFPIVVLCVQLLLQVVNFLMVFVLFAGTLPVRSKRGVVWDGQRSPRPVSV